MSEGNLRLRVKGRKNSVREMSFFLHSKYSIIIFQHTVQHF